MNSNTSEEEIPIMLSACESIKPGIKRCSTCRRTLPKTEYHKNKMRTDGVTNECKKCASKRQKGLYRGFRRLRIQYGVMMRRAERVGTPFNITLEEFIEWERNNNSSDSMVCPYCGLTIIESKAFQKLRGKKRVCGFTVDRIDNAKGYSLDNIQRICFLCNTIKGAWFASQEMKNLGAQLRKIQQSALNLSYLGDE